MEAPIKNRRRAPRAKLSLPVRIRCFDSNWTEEIGRTSNVSREGLYFETSARHYLDQFLRSTRASVVRNFQPGDTANLEELGRIVRVDRLPDGKFGVAMHILGCHCYWQRGPAHATTAFRSGQHRPVSFSARRIRVSRQADSDAERRRVFQRYQATAPDHGAHYRSLEAALSALRTRWTGHLSSRPKAPCTNSRSARPHPIRHAEKTQRRVHALELP